MDEFHKMYGSDTDNVGALIQEVSRHKIYFGHQSVGRNIISGIEQWEQESGIQLDIVESKDFSNTGETSFVHFNVGTNGDPQSKINEFVSMVESIQDETFSTAFFKLGYSDIRSYSDVDAIFEYYKEKMFHLKENHPNIGIILFTVPVIGIHRGLKVTVKRVLSRHPYGVIENIQRNEFNERILTELSDDFSVFDLAAVEYTLPDGNAQTSSYKGKEYPYLPGLYTSDGGHLNDFGSRIVGYNLLAFLANVLK